MSHLNLKQPLNRRTFLRASGIGMALPFLESMLPTRATAAAAAANPKRLAVVTQDLGVLHDTFFPVGPSSMNYEMPSVLSELATIRDNMTVFSHIDHGIKGGHHGAGGVLNGVKPEYAASSPFGAISVDQRAAEIVGPAVRYSSLRCWGGKNLSSSYSRQGSRLPSSANTPSELYKALFLQGTEEEKAHARALLNEGKSILDLVSGDAKALARDLGKADNDKLEEFFDSVRTVELQMSDRDQWLDRPKPDCPDPNFTKAVTSGKTDDLGNRGTLAAWMDLMHLALVTDSTRVTTTAIPMNDGVWDLPGVTTGAHALSHHGQEEWKKDQFRTIQRYILGEYRRFIEKLKNDKQPDGSSLLDSTYVLYASGLSNGATHSNENLPVILAGGKAKHGSHLNVESKQNLNSLYLSILQTFDPALTAYNNADKSLQGIALA
ncbi:MAG: DUF1552 domain-containing protein [Verrucomicrobiota bacterium]